MATGRIRLKDRRVYVDGFNVSGMARTIGPLNHEYDVPNLTAHMGDTVKGYLRGQVHATPGVLNTVFDNTATTGVHTLFQGEEGTKRTVLVAQGVLATPVAGDPCFFGQYVQNSYLPYSEGGAVVVNVHFGGWAADASIAPVGRAWGVLLDPGTTARTAVNSSTGIDDNGAATSAGGYGCYHVLSSSNASHTGIIKIQDAATNADGSFADLAGATTGVITLTAGVSGLLIPSTLTVRRYLRWQIVMTTITSVTFVLGFNRA
jgi:hypothetical protein